MKQLLLASVALLGLTTVANATLVATFSQNPSATPTVTATIDSGDFARHSQAAPQVGAMGDRFVVDLYDPVRLAARQALTDLAIELQDTAGVAIQAQLSAACQHTVAFYSLDDF